MADIAIIGSGISGLTCAWWLNRCGHDVTVYAGGTRVGGASHTVLARTVQGPTVAVDAGFLLFSEAASPNLVQLFAHLDVPMLRSEHSFSYSSEKGAYEYATCTKATLFAQPSLVASSRHWTLLSQIRRFRAKASAGLTSEDNPTLGQYLSTQGYSESFIQDYIAPLGQVLFMLADDALMNMPARTFITLCAHQGLLRGAPPTRWITVKGGSIEYIRKLTADYADRIVPAAVTRVKRSAAGLLIEADGNYVSHNQVVMACAPTDALPMLADATPDEMEVLGCFSSHTVRALLHQDDTLMPKRGAAWASYSAARTPEGALSTTCWLNQIQDIPDETPLFLSFNPATAPKDELTLAEFSYTRTLPDAGSAAAQPYIGALQGVGGIWYCGGWTGLDTHEDAVTSGLNVAEYITGQTRDWQVTETAPAATHTAPQELEAEAA